MGAAETYGEGETSWAESINWNAHPRNAVRNSIAMCASCQCVCMVGGGEGGQHICACMHAAWYDLCP